MAVSERILIADDEETFRLSIAELLRREGYECESAADGATATALLRNGDFALLIADVRMAGNVDLELIRDLPTIAEGVPVILVTGYPSLRSAVEAFELPVIAYLVKPLDFEELLVRVRQAIEYFHTYRATAHVHARLEDWRRELETLQELMKTTPGRLPDVATSGFLFLTLGSVISILLDLMQWAHGADLQQGDPHVTRLLSSPQLGAVKQVLIEAISALEKSKGAFKSKELGNLRMKLERLLEDAPANQ